MKDQPDHSSYGLRDEMITLYVRRLLHEQSIEILSWDTELVSFRSYAPSTRYILDVSGVARTRTRLSKWRILVKTLQRPSTDPSDSGWDREIKAYERVVSQVPSTCQLRAPRFLGADRPSAESARLWIEYVDGSPARDWKPATWHTLAAGLAVLQSHFLEDGHLLSESWLNHNDLRHWVEADRANLFPMRLTDSVRRLMAPLVDADVMRVVGDLWRERNRFIDRLDSLPQTICHNDVWSGNAVGENLGKEGQRPVIFDWQLLGPGPIGSDLAFGIVAGIWLGLLPSDAMSSLESALLSGYEWGLRESGQAALVQQAKEAFALTAAMRYAFMLPQLIEDLADQKRLSIATENSGLVARTLLKQRADLIKAGASWAIQGRS